MGRLDNVTPQILVVVIAGVGLNSSSAHLVIARGFETNHMFRRALIVLLVLVVQGDGRMCAVVILDILFHIDDLLLDALGMGGQVESHPRRPTFF